MEPFTFWRRGLDADSHTENLRISLHVRATWITFLHSMPSAIVVTCCQGYPVLSEEIGASPTCVAKIQRSDHYGESDRPWLLGYNSSKLV